ncbi:MAG: twin-arginine translocase subunit TatC [Caldilineaceae bacterium]
MIATSVLWRASSSWIGVAFEAPLILAFWRARHCQRAQLLRMWRQALVVIAVIAAITPTVDPVNMTIVMGP